MKKIWLLMALGWLGSAASVAWAHPVEAMLKARAQRAFDSSPQVVGLRKAMRDKNWASQGVQIIDLGRSGPPDGVKARMLFAEIWERPVANFIQNRTLAANLEMLIPGPESDDAKAVRTIGLKVLTPLEMDQLPSGDDPSDGG